MGIIPNLPGGYKEDGPAYPLIIFLHGMGERGNSQTNPDALKKVLVTGLPKLIEKKNWTPAHPAIVVSPQCHDDWWNDQKIHDHLTYILQKYNINKSRVYITGLSMGAFGTFNYIEKFGDKGYAAAALPIAGGGNLKNLEGFKNIPVWAFHGDADKTVTPDKSISMIAAINELDPLHQAKMTVYPGVGHFSWDMTYDGSGMGKESPDYDTFSEDIYSWFFRYRKE